MRKIVKSVIASSVIVGFAAIGGMANDWIESGATVYKEYKAGDFNPYGFQEESRGLNYNNAYSFQPEAKNAELYSEYKEGGFNPYGFENQESSTRFAEAFAPVRS